MTVDFAGRTGDSVILSEVEGAKGKILRLTTFAQNDRDFAGGTADNVILSEAEGAKGKILRLATFAQNDREFGTYFLFIE